MGCSASTIVSGKGMHSTISKARHVHCIENGEFLWVDKAWQEICSHTQLITQKNYVSKRSDWITVRIFVSSTFKDFHQEREILVKEVFPELRIWCERQRIHLVDCDLRWGIPKDFGSEETLRVCLGELDRCKHSNIMPFFINMVSERIGWIPAGDEIPDAIRAEYSWVEGLSVTEMEIMHGAYRSDNPNAIFLLRDPKFLDLVPEDHRLPFVDSNPVAPYKLEILKRMINEKFPSEQLCRYEVEYIGYNPETKLEELAGLDKEFATRVHDFFKERISFQYPLIDEPQDKWQAIENQHESFVHQRSATLIGRDVEVNQLVDWLNSGSLDVPILLVGGAGSGKSSVIAKVANLMLKGKHEIVGGPKDTDWLIFYHFIGATPNSTDLLEILQRLLITSDPLFADPENESHLPKNMELAGQAAYGLMSSSNAKPTIIIIDALNQLDEDIISMQMSWVPRKLSPRCRVLFSMIPGTPQHVALVAREPKPKAILVQSLDFQDRKAIVENTLARYSKRLDDEQMDCLLRKSASQNPLWLSLACEELRLCGLYREIINKIKQLPNELIDLEVGIIARIESKGNSEYIMATLCLLEVSKIGLLESELQRLLVMKPLLPGGCCDDKDEEETEKSGPDRLVSYQWSKIYAALKTFLRPFGASSEGRLDFYHRSFSKAVRQRYFINLSDEERTKFKLWWHCKLADCFEESNILHRQIEEYPFHLCALQDKERLCHFLLRWEVFDEMYDPEFSRNLVHLWLQGCNKEMLECKYEVLFRNMKNSNDESIRFMETLENRLKQVSKLLLQCGCYTLTQAFLKEAQEIEVTTLGSRPEKMVELEWVQAQLYDEMMKQEEYMYRSQLPRMIKIINHYKCAAEIFRKFGDDQSLFKLALILNRLSFYFSGISLRGGTDGYTVDFAKEKAVESVDEAISIFRRLKKDIHVADSLTTKGVSCGKAVPEQIKLYQEAYHLLMNLSPTDPKLERLLLNMGIYYEEVGQHYQAFDMFLKWYQLCADILGLDHPRTTRPISTLKEPIYFRIIKEKGLVLPRVNDGQ